MTLREGAPQNADFILASGTVDVRRAFWNLRVTLFAADLSTTASVQVSIYMYN